MPMAGTGAISASEPPLTCAAPAATFDGLVRGRRSKGDERQDTRGAHQTDGYLMTREHGEDVTDTGHLRELHGALLSTQSVEQFLHEMAVMAARLGSDGLSCGMTMQPSGKPVTVACSDRIAARVDEVQYELDDGPCLHAMRDGHLVRIQDTAEKARWPEFEAQAALHGIRSCLALPLNEDGKPVGALNLYSRETSAF